MNSRLLMSSMEASSPQSVRGTLSLPQSRQRVPWTGLNRSESRNQPPPATWADACDGLNNGFSLVRARFKDPRAGVSGTGVSVLKNFAKSKCILPLTPVGGQDKDSIPVSVG